MAAPPSEPLPPPPPPSFSIRLQDKDMDAVFSAVDNDNSGVLEFGEFFNNLRKDQFPRTSFFWSKMRPNPLLKTDEERQELLSKLGN